LPPIARLAAGAAASVLAGLAAVVGAEAARRLGRRLGARSDPAPEPVPGDDRSVSEAEERERALLDVLASDDPGRLVVFTLRRARGYAEQARLRLSPDRTDAGPRAVRRRRAARLAGLDQALDRFRVTGVPVDDLIAVRRLERWAAELAATARPPGQGAKPGSGA
jgi:hypothetical protein